MLSTGSSEEVNSVSRLHSLLEKQRIVLINLSTYFITGEDTTSAIPQKTLQAEHPNVTRTHRSLVGVIM